MLTLSLLLAASFSLHLVLWRRLRNRVSELEIWREVAEVRRKRNADKLRVSLCELALTDKDSQRGSGGVV